MTTDFNAAIMSARDEGKKERKKQIRQKLIDDYKKEFERVNGKSCAICYTSGKSSWIEIDRNFYRIGEVKKMLTTLQTRATYKSL